MKKIMFAEEGAVYNLVGTADHAMITKLPSFDTSQSLHIPSDWVYFSQLPVEVNELIYYYSFLYALKDRNYEAAYYYSTHVSVFLTRKIWRLWFEDPNLDLNFDDPADLHIIYSQLRCYITFASLIFDVHTERSDEHQVYPVKLEFNSRFRRRTRPLQLTRIPDPCSFVDNHLAFNLIELEEPIMFGESSSEISEIIDIVSEDSEGQVTLERFESPVLQNVNFLEFRRGPLNGDYCLLDGTPVAPAIFQVKRLVHPCVFIELFDCVDDPWVNMENYKSIQRSAVWKKFEKFLQFTIDPNLGLFFRVAPTYTFVTFE